MLVGPVASRDITLGPNLVASGNFRGWDDQRTAPGWAWIDQATGGKSNRALFVAAPDNLEPWAGPSIRISGLWRDADSAGATAAFGARAPALSLEPRSAYLAACYYRTERVPDDGANVYVSDDPMRLVPGGDIRLPATGGRWRRVVVLVPNPSSASVTIIPLLRSASVGDIWFCGFEIRKIRLPDARVPQSVVSRVLP